MFQKSSNEEALKLKNAEMHQTISMQIPSFQNSIFFL
jgi:hypothetical protein